jgi:preprotein translocase subunit SecD
MKAVAGFLVVIGLLGWVNAEEGKKVDRLQFRLGEREPGAALTEMTVSGSKEKAYLREKVELSQADVAQASAAKTKQWAEITLVFTEAGKEKLAKLTQENKGKLLCIVVDGKLVAAPTIVSPIPAGKAALTGNFSLEEANRIVSAILGKKDQGQPGPGH